MTRHAEIAGAGFAGLTAGIALLQNGWSVRVHERTPFLRSEGFGVAIHANGLRVLEALGVLDTLVPFSIRIVRRTVRDIGGRTISSIAFPGVVTTRRMSRDKIVSVMADRLSALGGEIATGSVAIGADPSGALIVGGGRRLPADLVIGADGYNSNVQNSVGLLARRIMLRDGAMRLVIPRFEAERDAAEPGCAESFENWSGTRRIICSPCSPTELYLAMSCLETDRDGQAVPINDAAWRASFPYLPDLFDRIGADCDWNRVKWVRFQIIRLRAWRSGRVALVGDAAHAMPPNLGQGGSTAMVNAYSLATAVSRDRDIPSALAAWEARERPVTEHAQRWSRLYGAVTFWPESLRSLAFKASARSAWIRRQLGRAADHVPLGLDVKN